MRSPFSHVSLCLLLLQHPHVGLLKDRFHTHILAYIHNNKMQKEEEEEKEKFPITNHEFVLKPSYEFEEGEKKSL